MKPREKNHVYLTWFSKNHVLENSKNVSYFSTHWHFSYTAILIFIINCYWDSYFSNRWMATEA